MSDASAPFPVRNFDVNQVTVAFQNDPFVAPLSDGRFVVAWQDFSRRSDDDSGYAIRGRIFGADGTALGDEFLINQVAFGYQTDPVIAALSGGRFVVTWTDSSRQGGDASREGIKGRIFEADGSAAGAEFLINQITAKDQNGSSVLTLPDGGFVVTWKDYSETNPSESIFAYKGRAYGADGAPSGDEFLIDSAENNPRDLSVAVLPNGGFAATWSNYSQRGADTSDSAVRGRVFGPDGTTVGSEFLVNQVTSRWQEDPSVAVLSNGRFIVTCTDLSRQGGDTDRASVRSRVFDADG